MNYTATFLSFISDDGYAAYRRGLQGILGEYALEWKTNLSALRLYLRALLQTYSEWGKGMYKFKDCRCRCIVRHGTMFEGGCRLESGSMRFVCSSRARKISSCLLAKEIHVISYYWGESAQRLNRYYRRPECLWHLYMRITDTRLSRTAGISVDGLPLELDRGILESYQTRHKRHLLPCWRVIG